MGFNNKLFPQDIRFLSHTKAAWPLLRGDGSVTTQIVACLRRARGGESFSGSYRMGAVRTSVRAFLNSIAVRTTPEYGYTEDSIHGVDWQSSYSSALGNVSMISSPILVMGMTGGYEYLASEMIYENARSVKDITLAFVEGASHVFLPALECQQYPGQFGDTVKTVFDFVDQWLNMKERFI